jgi:hypothetical protein
LYLALEPVCRVGQWIFNSPQRYMGWNISSTPQLRRYLQCLYAIGKPPEPDVCFVIGLLVSVSFFYSRTTVAVSVKALSSILPIRQRHLPKGMTARKKQQSICWLLHAARRADACFYDPLSHLLLGVYLQQSRSCQSVLQTLEQDPSLTCLSCKCLNLPLMPLTSWFTDHNLLLCVQHLGCSNLPAGCSATISAYGILCSLQLDLSSSCEKNHCNSGHA